MSARLPDTAVAPLLNADQALAQVSQAWDGDIVQRLKD